MPINTTPPSSFDSQHEDLIHDAQMDYYGRRLATASSDRTVRLFACEPGMPENHLHTLTGHEGPVWRVAWSHPKFGALLATASYDGRVLIWKEQTTNTGASAWSIIKEHRVHESSVNDIAWCPVEFGLQLACASSDGKVSLVQYDLEQGVWSSNEWHAHQIGCNSVTWSPSSRPESLLAAGVESAPVETFSTARLATGGCDNLVKIWVKKEGSQEGWTLESELAGHSDWVRDVVWAPNIGLPMHTLVSCAQDKTVLIWQSTDSSPGSWTSRPLTAEPFPDTLWRVSFSPEGNLLAVAGGDNRVSMWRQDADGEWKCLSNLDQATLK